MISKADLPFRSPIAALIFVAAVILSVWAYRKFAPATVQSQVPV